MFLSMRKLFVFSLAVYAVRDSKSWGRKPSLEDESFALVVAMLSISTGSLVMAAAFLVLGGAWFDNTSDLVMLAALICWYFMWHIFVKHIATKSSKEIGKNMRLLVSLPPKRWIRIRITAAVTSFGLVALPPLLAFAAAAYAF